MGRSKKITITIPTRMWEALEKLAPLCGYRNATEMVTWSPLYSFQVPTLHMMTAPLAAMDRAAQDKAIEDAVGPWERGEAASGAFFEDFIAEVMRRIGTTAPPDTVRAVIADVWRTFRNKSREPQEPGQS